MLAILKLLNAEEILVMQIKDERNQGFMDLPNFNVRLPLVVVLVIGTWTPETSHYHRMKFWAKHIFWSGTELRKEEFMRLVPDLQWIQLQKNPHS